MVFGHISGFFAYLTSQGKRLEKTRGGEQYCPPMRGMLLSYKMEAARLYDSVKDILLPAQLAIFALGVTLDERAVAWALKSIDAARRKRNYQVLPVFGFIIVCDLLIKNRYSDALDLALEAAAITIACGRHGKDTLPLGPEELRVNEVLGAKPSENWNEAENFSILVGLLPAVLRLGTIDLENREAVRAYASDINDACQRIAVSASNPLAWKRAAELIVASFVNRMPAKELIPKGKEFADRGLLMIAFIGASVQDDLALSDCCRLHIWIMRFAKTNLTETAYRQIAVPFIREFWTKAFNKRRFEFSMPQMLENELKAARRLSSDKQAQEILRLISSSLNVRLSPEVHQWLKEI